MPSRTTLKRDISFGPLLVLAINAIIGTGIFFVPAIAASVAGPASIFSWILVALLAIFISMCFAELSGMYPKCGGVYEFTKHAFGESIGFLVGWIGWVVANITAAMLVVGSFNYLATLVPMTHTQILIFSMLFVVIINIVSTRGIKLSVKVLLIFAAVTILSMWLLISWGIYHVQVQNINPIFTNLPTASILFAMVFVLETFFGWETVTYLAEETKDARHKIPKVMIYGTIAVVLLALGVVVIALGVLPWQTLANSTSPLADVAYAFMGSMGANIVALLIFLNIMGAAAAWIITTPRLIFALARDKLLPPLFGKLHAQHKTPVNAIILQTILTCFVISSGSYMLLLKVLLPLAIVMYSGVILSVPTLRLAEPDMKRTFKVPLGEPLPIVVVAFLIFLMHYIEANILALGFFFILVGVPMYLFMAMQYNPSISKKLLDFSTFLTRKTYDKWAPKELRERILRHLGDLEDKVIMDFGCDIGMLSIELAVRMGKKGRVHATEVSSKNIKAAKKLAREKNVHDRISFILEDPKSRHRFHSDIKGLDGVVSVGTLGYLPNPEKALKEIHRRMKRGGKVYFVDYDHLFRIVPSQSWLEDDKSIEQMFKRVGFSVTVEREKKILWDVLHIYGEKR